MIFLITGALKVVHEVRNPWQLLPLLCRLAQFYSQQGSSLKMEQTGSLFLNFVLTFRQILRLIYAILIALGQKVWSTRPYVSFLRYLMHIGV